jgi:hypothetical protein
MAVGVEVIGASRSWNVLKDTVVRVLSGNYQSVGPSRQCYSTVQHYCITSKYVLSYEATCSGNYRT